MVRLQWVRQLKSLASEPGRRPIDRPHRGFLLPVLTMWPLKLLPLEGNCASILSRKSMAISRFAMPRVEAAEDNRGMDILSLQFLSALAAIVVIDLMLAGDNAIVIA